MPSRIALLLHALRDGSSHVDLLIEREGPPCPDDLAGVPTWRCASRPDQAASPTTVRVERIGEHRGVYLHLEGPRELSADRGSVTPLRRGRAERRGDEFHIRWDDGGTAAWAIDDATDEGLLTILANRSCGETGGDDSRSTGARPDPHGASSRASPP